MSRHEHFPSGPGAARIPPSGEEVAARALAAMRYPTMKAPLPPRRTAMAAASRQARLPVSLRIFGAEGPHLLLPFDRWLAEAGAR